MGLGISQKFRLAWLIKPLHSLQIYTVLSTSKETLEIKTQSDGSKILSTYFWLTQNLLKKRGGRVYVAAIRGGDFDPQKVSYLVLLSTQYLLDR